MYKSLLSQGEPRDAAVIGTYQSLQRRRTRFLCHSTAFLYSPTSATVQMLKLHTVRWFSRPWRQTRR